MQLSPSAAVPAPLTKLSIWHAGKVSKVGLMRPITIWPLADRQIKELASKVKGILVHELNYGQYVLEVERVVAGQVPVALYAKYDNEPATPAQLLAEIKKAMA